MTLLTAPLWIQLALVAEAAALCWLTWRFGARGLLWGAAACVAFWFVLGLAASFLVSRLEGGGATPLSDIVVGAVLGAVRVGLIALPIVALGAVGGALLRRFLGPRRAGV